MISSRLSLVCLTLLVILFPRAVGAAGKPEAVLYVARPPSAAELARYNTRARFEPPYGCYLGAFIDFDGTLTTTTRDQNGTPHHDPDEFERIVNKPHAMYFFYLGYGKRLPLDWVRELGRRNKFVHIALEPNNGLNKVKDDAYLRQLADDMARSGAKIFLRFASEMNGAWVVYSKNPKQYREKFRLVHQVMHKRAPNVATVWCPFTIPQESIPKYYPGDDGTDWVGVNMYNVTYHNNHRDEPGENEHPADLLEQVYRLYSARKPVMICEYAATHYAAVEGVSRPDHAMRKILTLYAALPRLFPRVKCINYFDGNNVQFVADRAYNDYSVTDDPLVIATYRYAIASPYFLSAPLPESSGASPSLPVPMPVRNGEPLRGTVKLSCWARSPSDFVSVCYKLDGYPIYRADRPDLWECLWNAASVAPGKHKLTLETLNTHGKVVAQQSVTVTTAP